MLKYSKKIFGDSSDFDGNLITMGDADVNGLSPSEGEFESNLVLFEKESSKESTLIEIKRETKNIKFGLKIPNEITMINVNHLENRDTDMSPYFYLSKEDKNLMKSSIERCGIIHPLIVFKKSDTSYSLVDGENRGICISQMFDETGDPKYENVPCIVLTQENFSYLDLREICISANLNRKCNSIEKRRLILMMAGIYRQRYTRLKEVNVAREIAGKLNISMSTVYNYLSLGNLCLAAQNFLNIGKIDLTSATKLAKLDEDFQFRILKEIGTENICDCVIKGLLKNEVTEKSYKKDVARVLSWRHPHTYKIVISGKYIEMEVVEKMIDDYFNHHTFELSGAVKKRVVGKCFDFTSGLSCFNEREIRIPKYFQKFIEDGEIGEYIPDSHFSNPSKYKKKGKIVKTETKLLEKPQSEEILEAPQNLEPIQNEISQEIALENQSENEENPNIIEIDYNDLFREDL